MTGKRIYPKFDKLEGHTHIPIPGKGEYFKTPDGGPWMVTTPNGYTGNLANHTVTEHEDGTITVRPSILITLGDGTEAWHGWLTKGIWKSC